MDEAVRTPTAPWSTVAATVAAFAVGAFFGARGFGMAGQSAFAELTQGFPFLPSGFAVMLVALVGGALLAVVVAAAAALTRVPGWPVAAVGLVVAYLAGKLAFDGAVSQQSLLAWHGLVLAMSAVGAGLALGGALLAIGRVARPLRWPVAAGLAAGLVLHSSVEDLFRWVVSDSYATSGRAWPVQVGVTVAATVVAALLAHRVGDAAAPTAGHPRVGPLVATAVAAVVTLGGLVLRWWVVDVFRVSQDGLVGPRREQFVESFAYFSTVTVAVGAGLVLLGYAYRIGRAAAARWVVLGVAAGPLVLINFRLTVFDGAWAYLVPLVGLMAAAAGAALARFASRVLPWDAAGLLLAAVALPLASQAVRGELPSVGLVPAALLSAVGLGVAFGFGLVLAADATGPAADAATGPAAAADAATEPAAPANAAAGLATSAGEAAAGGEPVGEPGGRVDVLVLGPAALVLSVLALAPVLVRAQLEGPVGGPPLAIPVFAGVAALLLVLFFGFGRAVDRIRRDLRAEAAAGSDRP